MSLWMQEWTLKLASAQRTLSATYATSWSASRRSAVRATNYFAKFASLPGVPRVTKIVRFAKASWPPHLWTVYCGNSSTRPLSKVVLLKIAISAILKSHMNSWRYIWIRNAQRWNISVRWNAAQYSTEINGKNIMTKSAARYFKNVRSAMKRYPRLSYRGTTVWKFWKTNWPM
jgi:hypothetical protein